MIKHNRKRIIAFTLTTCFVVSFSLYGCASNNQAQAPGSNTDVVVQTVDEETSSSDTTLKTVDDTGVGYAVTGKGSVADISSKLIDASIYEMEAPFSDASWSSTEDEVAAMEGTSSSTYDSVYGGTTYVYNKSFDGNDGVIKYMFDDKNALMCVAFTFTADTPEDIYSLYESIHKDLVDKYGESGYQAEHDTNYGDVWYRTEGDIVISSMITSTQNALQFSFLNPIISKNQMEEAAKQQQ